MFKHRLAMLTVLCGLLIVTSSATAATGEIPKDQLSGFSADHRVPAHVREDNVAVSGITFAEAYVDEFVFSGDDRVTFEKSGSVVTSAGADRSDFGEMGSEQRATLMLHGDFSSFQSNLGGTGGYGGDAYTCEGPKDTLSGGKAQSPREALPVVHAWIAHQACT